MRTLLVAALAFAPLALHAQAVSPAQTATAPQLESKLNAPAFPATASVPSNRRISTGVIAPKLSTPVNVVVTQSTYSALLLHGQTAVKVSMIVDAKGVPSQLKVADTLDPVLGAAVLDAVAQSRFTPGSVSNTPIAVPVDLTVTVRASSAL